jgi:transketolase
MTELNERSKQVRRDTYALSKANGGYHYGGCFSATEILIALFDHIMTEDDVFILSKGHACWPMYVLLREKGKRPKLEGHPSRDPHNGVAASTGSLGHGLPIGVGRAIARKILNKPGRVFVLMGDGECQEGTTWESMLIAGHHRLGNLTLVVDYNRIQGSGFIEDISLRSMFCMQEIAEHSGWASVALPGHNIELLNSGLSNTAAAEMDRPQLIIAETIKGKGVSIMENKPEWHAKWPNAEEEEIILRELA